MVGGIHILTLCMKYLLCHFQWQAICTQCPSECVISFVPIVPMARCAILVTCYECTKTIADKRMPHDKMSWKYSIYFDFIVIRIKVCSRICHLNCNLFNSCVDANTFLTNIWLKELGCSRFMKCILWLPIIIMKKVAEKWKAACIIQNVSKRIVHSVFFWKRGLLASGSAKRFQKKENHQNLILEMMGANIMPSHYD